VQFRFLTFNDEIYVLIQVLCKITDHSRKSAEQLSNWQHPDFHDTFLKLSDNAGNVIGYLYQIINCIILVITVMKQPTYLTDPSLVNDQLSYQIHKMLQTVYIYPDCLRLMSALPWVRTLLHRSWIFSPCSR